MSWTSSLLVGLLQLLHVTSAPSIKPNDWKITKDWDPKAQILTYEATSTEIPTQCRDRVRAHINFPLIIHGSQQILADGKLLVELNDPTFSKMNSFYSAPSIPCRELLIVSQITWRVTAYARFFARFNSFPTISNQSSLARLFGETLPILASGALLVIAVFLVIIFFGKAANNLILSLSLGCVFLGLYFLVSAIGAFEIALSMLAAHKLADMSVLAGNSLIFNALRLTGIIGSGLYTGLIFFTAMGCSFVLFGTNGDSVQFGTMLPFPYAIILCTVGMIHLGFPRGPLLIRRGRIPSLIGLIIFFMSCINDMLLIIGLIPTQPLLPVGVLAALVFFSFSLAQQTEFDLKEKRQLQIEAKLGKLAAQVSHDIRSPLAALKVLGSELLNLPVDQRLLVQSTTDRIQRIADGLLKSYHHSEQNAVYNTVSLYFVPKLIEEILIEKRILLRERPQIKLESIESDGSKEAFSELNDTEFRRLISNLVNNSIESISTSGLIRLVVGSNETKVTILIEDSGCGIPPNIMSSLFESGATFSKSDGTGLGLSHAKERISSWGGTIKISAGVHEGTCVRIVLPKRSPQVSEIQVPSS